MSLISMHGAWLSFSDSPLLDNAELHIEDNERVCLVGRNGAGKSTLMKILNREQGLDDGRIVYEQDLIVSRLQQDPPRHVTGSVYDFVAEGISEQAEYLKRYHEISHLVMNRIWNCPRSPAAGCVKRLWAARWSAGRRCCCWTNRPTTWISKRLTGWKGS